MHTIKSSKYERIFEWFFLLVVFFAPLVFGSGLYDYANLPKLIFIQIGTALIFFLWLLIKIKLKESKIVIAPVLYLIAALIVWSWLSLTWAHNRYESFLKAIHLLLCGIMFLLVVQFVANEKAGKRLLLAVFLSGFMVALIGYLQHLSLLDLIPQTRAPSSTFGNKNMAVHVIVLTLPLGFMHALTSSDVKKRLAFTLALTVMIAYLYHTQTRAGWIALFVQLFVVAILLVRERIIDPARAPEWKKNTTVALVCGVFFLLLMNLTSTGIRWTLPETISRANQILLEIDSVEDQIGADDELVAGNPRVPLWINSFEMIRDHFFLGVGIGNFNLTYPMYSNSTVRDPVFSMRTVRNNTHNDYIQFFAELGIVGFLLFVFLFAFTLFICVKLLSKKVSRDTRLVALSIISCIVGIAIDAFFSFPFQRAIPPFFLMIYLAVASRLMTIVFHKEIKSISISSRLRIPFAAVSLAFLGAMCFWGVRQLRADAHFLKLFYADKKKNFRTAMTEAERVLSFNPFRKNVWLSIGRAQIELGDVNAAARDLEYALEYYPYNLAGLMNLGIAYSHTGKFEKAVESFQRIIDIKPDVPIAHDGIGKDFLRQKKYEEAEQVYETALEIMPSNDALWYGLGLSSLVMQKYDAALSAFEITVEIEPNKAQNQFMLGNLLVTYFKKVEDGAEYLRRSLDIDSRHQFADQARELLKRIQID